MVKYPELHKALKHYERLIPAQHMGTVGDTVPTPSEMFRELTEILEEHDGCTN